MAFIVVLILFAIIFGGSLGHWLNKIYDVFNPDEDLEANTPDYE